VAMAIARIASKATAVRAIFFSMGASGSGSVARNGA
jgi:hypothetical protein